MISSSYPDMCVCLYNSLGGSEVKNPPAKQEMQIWSSVGKIPWRGKWQPTSVFLPGKFHGQRNLAGYSLWGCRVIGLNDWTATTVWCAFSGMNEASMSLQRRLKVLAVSYKIELSRKKTWRTCTCHCEFDSCPKLRFIMRLMELLMMYFFDIVKWNMWTLER